MAAADVWQRLADLVVEQAKQAHQAGPFDPEASRFSVPWGPQELDGGVLLARSAAEQRHEQGRCFEQTTAIAHSEGTSYRRLTPRSKAIFGVDDAARWTTGSTLASPLSRVDALVNGHNLVHEMDLAMEVVRLRADEWEKAIGSYVWLRWLTGADEAITYPLW